MSSEGQGTTTGPRPPVASDPVPGPVTGRGPTFASENARLIADERAAEAAP